MFLQAIRVKNNGWRIGLIGLSSLFVCSYSAANHPEDQKTIHLQSQGLTRELDATGGRLRTTSFQIDGHELLEAPATELAFQVQFATPNQMPIGIKPGESGQEPRVAKGNMEFPEKLLRRIDAHFVDTRGVVWGGAVQVDSQSWDQQSFKIVRVQTYSLSEGVTRVDVTARATEAPLDGLHCTLTYETYDEAPVIRKWISIENKGNRWIKIDRLELEGVVLKPEFRNRTALAPGSYKGITLSQGRRYEEGNFERDSGELGDHEAIETVIGPSVVSFSTPDRATGVIAASEIPSAMRQINRDGSMGYRMELFEWVLGPDESFVSEPVFYYGYSGDVQTTASAVSTPCDRAAEGPFKDFLSRYIGMRGDEVPLYAPLWNTFDAVWRDINDKSFREQAVIAARAGFQHIEIDAGWQWDDLGMRIDEEDFPNFAETCAFAESLGLKVGLWVSNYRTEGDADLELYPQHRAVPLRIKNRKFGAGYGMSFASKWRERYARDMIDLHHDYGIVGFKQDHSNIRAGDVGLDNESRTRKESLLRGFRGLFTAQEILSAAAPDVVNQLTHETYWDAPNPGADLASLKYFANVHVPPNANQGSEDMWNIKQGKRARWSFDSAEARQKELLKGCMTAREVLYSHRALPLHYITFYGLMTINDEYNSLTDQIVDRQICSLLMGAPLLFAGDLTTLTEQNIDQYAKRFELLERLETSYGIYRNFQYSGVPAPTDTDWHWWGKLNADGHGAVVVMRGDGGQEQRTVNIPWVDKGQSYKVTSCFSNQVLGVFTGAQLQEGALKLSLPVYGQDILEIASAGN